MKKTQNILRTRLTALLLALVCVFGLLPSGALAAVPDTIKLERFGMYGISYDSANLGHCTLHEMFFDIGGNKTEVGFCGTKGGGMSNSLIGQTWSNKRAITDPTVKYMLAYYYSHINSQFTDEAHALGVDAPWDGPWAWYMNAWMQAVVWRYLEGTLNDPVLACAQEMVDVWNSLSGG